MSTNNKIINANPTKDFFIYMITRDIDLKYAILELVDNCIDGATKIRPEGDFTGLWVKINISEKEFCIEDNCGGISIQIAENYAFRFGRPKNAENNIDFSTGIFGIGMKRALFKIGKYFIIESKTKNSIFKVQLDVNEWASDDKQWNFKFYDIDENCNNIQDECGTKIKVTNLYEGIMDDFKLDFFKQELKKHIQNYVSLGIEKGLKISLNSVNIDSNVIELYNSDSLRPAYEEYSINGVKIRILAGIGKTGDPDAAGWYIYCNGRLILASDQSTITGWDENTPKFHPTYARFRGFVFFDAKDSALLPWNTTKTGVDASSPVFINAKVKMKNMFRSVKDVLSKIKKINDEAEREDIEEFIDSCEKIQISSINVAKINLGMLSNKISATFLSKSSRTYTSDVTISYKKPKNEVEKVKDLLGITSNKDVGEKTFDYFLKMESEE